MPLHKQAQGFFQYRRNDLFLGLQQHSLVPVMRVGEFLLKKPPLYGSELYVTVARCCRKRGDGRISLDHLRKFRDCPVMKQLPGSKYQPSLPCAIDNLNTHDGIATQLKEIAMNAYPLDTQRFRPKLCQNLLVCRPRGRILIFRTVGLQTGIKES